MGLEKPLDAIIEADLLELIKDSTPESQKIEYKRALNLEGEKAKVEFFADISSFANSSGGDILFGVDAKNGVANKTLRLESFDPDAMKLKLGQLCAAHINPPIHGVQFKEVPLTDGGHALIARIPKTWNGPHMVTFNGDHRFYVRNDNGKTIMTCPELRRAFILSDSLARTIKNFRLERLGNIVTSETPVPLPGTAKIVLHILPLMAFEQDSEIDLKSIKKSPHALPINYRTSMLWSPTEFNFDGLISSARDKNQNVLSYLQIFRDGCLEAIDAYTLEARQGHDYFTDRYEREIITALQSYLGKLAREMKLYPPAYVCLSLVGIKGFHLFVGTTPSPNKTQRDQLVMQELLVEDWDTDVKKLMRPSFDVVWQTFGFDRCGNYDLNGDWIGGRFD